MKLSFLIFVSLRLPYPCYLIVFPLAKINISILLIYFSCFEEEIIKNKRSTNQAYLPCPLLKPFLNSPSYLVPSSQHKSPFLEIKFKILRHISLYSYSTFSIEAPIFKLSFISSLFFLQFPC